MSTKKAKFAADQEKPTPIAEAAKAAAEVPTTPVESTTPVEPENPYVDGHELKSSESVDPAAQAGTDPTDGGVAEVVTSPTDATPPVAEPTKTPTKVYKVGSREFGSADELAAYVTGLEQSKLDLLDSIRTPEVPTEPEDPNPADIIFEDPHKAVELIEKRVDKKLRAEKEANDRAIAQRDANQATWTKFYSDYPDLVGETELVQDAVNSVAKELGENTSPERGLPIVAERVRKQIARIIARHAPSETLRSSIAVTAGSTTASVPKKAPSVVATSFVQELRAARKRG